MDRKKFRLSTRKSKERKNYQKRLTIAHGTVSDDDIGELVVRLPISAYLSAKAQSFHVLCDKMKNSDIIVNYNPTIYVHIAGGASSATNTAQTGAAKPDTAGIIMLW